MVRESACLSMPKSQQSWVRFPVFSDTVESEGRQIKQCWITYIKRKIKKKPLVNYIFPGWWKDISSWGKCRLFWLWCWWKVQYVINMTMTITMMLTIYAPMIYTDPNGTRLSARCHFTVSKNSRFPGPNPLPLALVMAASKALRTGLYKSYVHK
jgi:hypothetical protein